jgi:ankyrin repeat protein
MRFTSYWSIDRYARTILTIDAMDETGQTALMQAAQDGTADEIKKLLKKGASLEVKDRYGWTALLYAATFNLGYLPNPKPDASALKILLSAGANVNVSDTRGITPLIIAAAEGRTEFVKLLLSKVLMSMQRIKMARPLFRMQKLKDTSK